MFWGRHNPRGKSLVTWHQGDFWEIGVLSLRGAGELGGAGGRDIGYCRIMTHFPSDGSQGPKAVPVRVGDVLSYRGNCRFPVDVKPSFRSKILHVL